MPRPTVHLSHLGIIPYQEAWTLQETLLAKNVALKKIGTPEQTKHYLLLCEHPPVFTIGKNGQMHNVLLSTQELRQKHIDFFQTNRGGDVTFHGPGQLVAYPILDLEKIATDIGKYLRTLEQVVIDMLNVYGIHGERSSGETGVWIAPQQLGQARKICAMGVKLSRWVSIHGLALNVHTDLSYFDFIIPCGIQGKAVTSMEKELQRPIGINEVLPSFLDAFGRHFHCTLSSVQKEALLEI